MSGIIDYFPLLEAGPCKRFSHPRKHSLPTSNHGSYPSPRTPASPPDWKNKSDADQGSQKWGGGWGGVPGRAAALVHREPSPPGASLMCCGMEKTLPAVCALPSQQILFQEAPSPPSPPCSSSQAPHRQPPYSPG